jgi:hypothetical protein
MLFDIAGLDQRFSTQITPRPVFEEKNFHDPQLRTFIICKPASFTLLSTKNIYNSHAHDPSEILHDPSVEKRWTRLKLIYV